MMKKAKIKKKISNYFFDHRYQYFAVHETYTFLMCVLSGILFAFGFACFTTSFSEESLRIVTGGASGISQNIILILEICGVKNVSMSIIYSILYLLV